MRLLKTEYESEFSGNLPADLRERDEYWNMMAEFDPKVWIDDVEKDCLTMKNCGCFMMEENPSPRGRKFVFQTPANCVPGAKNTKFDTNAQFFRKKIVANDPSNIPMRDGLPVIRRIKVVPDGGFMTVEEMKEGGVGAEAVGAEEGEADTEAAEAAAALEGEEGEGIVDAGGAVAGGGGGEGEAAPAAAPAEEVAAPGGTKPTSLLATAFAEETGETVPPTEDEAPADPAPDGGPTTDTDPQAQTIVTPVDEDAEAPPPEEPDDGDEDPFAAPDVGDIENEDGENAFPKQTGEDIDAYENLVQSGQLGTTAFGRMRAAVLAARAARAAELAALEQEAGGQSLTPKQKMEAATTWVGGDVKVQLIV